MARAKTKEKKAGIKKMPAPNDMNDLVDYQISTMHQYESFQYADILVLETNEYVRVHNKYGSWRVGPPELAGQGNEGDLQHSVCAKLQHRLKIFKIEQAKIASQIADNPFAAQVADPTIDLTGNMFAP